MRFWKHLEYQKATRRAPRAPKKPPRSSRGVLKRLPRGSLEVLWELLEVQKAPQATILDTFIGFRASKNPPGGPQVTIYRPCRRFRASRRGTGALEICVGRARSDPRTRSRTRFIISLFIQRQDLDADAPSSPEGRRLISNL